MNRGPCVRTKIIELFDVGEIINSYALQQQLDMLSFFHFKLVPFYLKFVEL